MNEDALGEALAHMRQRIRGVPFHVAIRSLSNCAVERIDLGSERDRQLLDSLRRVGRAVMNAVAMQPIVRPRANEVGNDVEPFVRDALRNEGLRVESPRSAGGVSKGVGYPDMLFFDAGSRPCYLECKTYSVATANTSMRSFYVSPSDEFKVCLDARHVALSFQMASSPAPGGGFSYTASAFRIVDLYDLRCDVKYEFNSDNRRLYDSSLILAEEAKA